MGPDANSAESVRNKEDLLCESLRCGFTDVRRWHTKGPFVLVGKVAIVDEQGINGRVLYSWRCVRWSVHERKSELYAAGALNKIRLRIQHSKDMRPHSRYTLLVTTSDGWESGFGPIEMLVSSVANSKCAIPGTSRASEVASRSAWSTFRVHRDNL